LSEKQLDAMQVGDLAFYMANPRGMNLSDPGCRKTGSACVYAYFLWTDKKVGTAWAMPKSLLRKNRDEMLAFTDFRPQDVIIVDGTAAQRAKQFASGAKVFLLGFDCFSTNWQMLPPFVSCVMIDEWHMGYGNNDSLRTQRLYDAMEKFEYFLPLTGTIINGKLSSAYPAVQIIDPTLYGSYDVFMLTHAIVDGYGKVLGWTNPGKLSKFFGKHAIRHSFEEVYGKEAKVVINEQCEMDPDQRAAYKEFEEAGLLELEDSWLEGSLPGVNFIRCRQLMEHPQTFGAPLDKIKYTGKELRLLVHLEHAKQTGKPLLIFAVFQPQQDRLVEICKKMGFRVGMINGTVSAAKRGQIDEDFQAGLLDIVVASAATASVGFNWGHLDTIIFMSIDFMDSSFLQGYRRAMRGVRTSPLLIYVMEYEKSADQRIFQIVEIKSAMAVEVDPTQVAVKISAVQVLEFLK
jgi:hypothetical protein